MADRRRSERQSKTAGQKRIRELAVPAQTQKIPKWRRWLYRGAALFLCPLLLLLVLEVALRVLGIGYSAHFFLKTRINGQPAYVENPNFGLRFFPRALVRSPSPTVMPVVKPTNTYRIFILGESAALGDPEPAFGFGRYLQVLLRGRYPGTRFEVVCTAMTAINSHVILPIARECAGLQGDLWVLYMGNNEVVGPFGAGTILGPKTPPLWLIRASLSLKRTRTGQLISSLSKLLGGHTMPKSWEGMKMFVDSQTRRGDASRQRTERYFAQNLADILETAHRAGVKVVLSTVASNLRDCAPFASLHARGLDAASQKTWDSVFRQGVEAQTGSRFSDAMARYTEAVRIDDQFAELQYRRGQTYLAVSNLDEARQSLKLARDLDALPFRTTSALNRLIAQSTNRVASGEVFFADAAESCAQTSPAGIAGDNLFYEHVHLNFAGNYLLALSVAEQVARALPPEIAHQGQARWISREQCEEHLAVTDWDRYRVYESIAQRVTEPPFTLQLNHEEEIKKLQQTVRGLKSRLTPEARQGAVALYRHAVAEAPDDFLLHSNFAKLLSDIGDFAESVAEWRRVNELLPDHAGPNLYLGRALVHIGQFSEAEACFRLVLRKHPDVAEAWDDLAQVLAKQRRLPESIDCYSQALLRQPANAVYHLHMADALAADGKRADAMTNLEAAVRYRPTYWEARYLLGVELAVQERIKEAADQFSAVVRLRPEFVPAHLNLGVALVKEGRLDDALSQFEVAAHLEPTNQTAMNYISKIQALKQQANKPPTTGP